MVPPAAAVAAAYFASDSIFLFCKEEWFRLQTAAMPELQRFMILGCQFGNRCRKTLKNGPTAAVILDFRPKLENRCKKTLENDLSAAVIPDFRPRLGNHYKVFLGISPNAAVILDFRG